MPSANSDGQRGRDEQVLQLMVEVSIARKKSGSTLQNHSLSG